MTTEKRNTILRLLVEGNSIRSVCRLMGTCIPSVLRQLLWAGEHCQALMDRHFTGLTLNHLETDEMWTFVLKKQSRLTIDERRERSDIGDIYLWYSIDQDTKLIPTFLLGKRSADNARRFMVELRSRLAMPTQRPHDTDPHAFRRPGMTYATQISTDGFTPYPEAVDLAFGPYVKFGTIVKDYKNATLPYTPSEIVGTKRRAVFGMNESEERSICTSHVERHNLTVRTFMRRFTRLALGFSKKLENLEAACALHMAYYNLCWRPGEMRVTPAMAAGVTDMLWSFDDLMDGSVD
jgi:IS1 family transposase